MDELWPNPRAGLDVVARVAGDLRPAFADRPWVTMLMVSSLDGAIAVDGLSEGLGGPADFERFVAARKGADVIVVGSRTAALEDYQPTTVPIAVLSPSLSADPAARLFSDPNRPPFIYTTSKAARARGGDFDGIANVIDLGDSLTPSRVLTDLHHRGMETVMLEGGPTINGVFLAEDLVDELLLTLSPLMVGGTSDRVAHGSTLVEPRYFELDRVVRAGDMLLLRHTRRRGATD